jgi:hypothetical protein
MADSAKLHTVVRPSWKAFNGQNHVAYSVSLAVGDFTVTNFKAKKGNYDIYLKKAGSPIQVRLGTLGQFKTSQEALKQARVRITQRFLVPKKK